MSQAKTAEEVRREIIEHLRFTAKYWAGLPNRTIEDRCNGLVHSILCMFDGVNDLPSMDIVLRPHPEDQQFAQGEGEDWYEDGMAINSDCMLHELYYL